MKKLLFLASILVLLTQACVTSRSLSKKGAKLEEAGQYVAAADMYYQSIKKNSRNVNALVGMKRTGQRVLNEFLQKFSKHALMEDYKSATYDYLDALDYQQKIRRVNVDLKIDPKYEAKFEEVKLAYISSVYEQGLKFIAIEEFGKAEKNFNEVYKFDQNYKDVAELRNIAFLEPIYRKAERLKDEKEYRAAYNIYVKILDRVGNYKETKEHKAYVLKKGQIPITLSSVKSGRYHSYAKSFKQYVLSAIMRINDPFIRIVDRDDIDKVLQEQELALSGRVNENQQVDVGEIAGAKYAVVFDVPSYSVEERPLRKQKKPAFESYVEKYYDEESGKAKYRTLYRKKTYTVYSAYRKVSMSASYKIISLSTGDVLGTDIITKAFESEVLYATYSGKKSRLYPSNEGHVSTSRAEYNRLQQLFRGNRNLASREVLTSEIYKEASDVVAKKIVNKFQ
jgi:tetratricopeptide (TPR) repeat protein